MNRGDNVAGAGDDEAHVAMIDGADYWMTGTTKMELGTRISMGV